MTLSFSYSSWYMLLIEIDLHNFQTVTLPPGLHITACNFKADFGFTGAQVKSRNSRPNSCTGMTLSLACLTPLSLYNSSRKHPLHELRILVYNFWRRFWLYQRPGWIYRSQVPKTSNVILHWPWRLVSTRTFVPLDQRRQKRKEKPRNKTPTHQRQTQELMARR